MIGIEGDITTLYGHPVVLDQRGYFTLTLDQLKQDAEITTSMYFAKIDEIIIRIIKRHCL